MQNCALNCATPLDDKDKGHNAGDFINARNSFLCQNYALINHLNA
uniref:Uncharacterized protein n=1 Tax=Anguilla anguilla TaxID=7936 RepID=A0A0E9TVR5_ANGAN